MRLTAKFICVFILLIALIVFRDVIFYDKPEASLQSENNEITYPEVPDSPLVLNLILVRKYIDGEISEELVEETVWALEDFWAKYEQWQLLDMDENHLVLQKEVDDISPLLKVNGFFGIAEDGTLSIFNGKPEKQDVIQSFFQIDVEKLEGKKRSQLQNGIPVKNKVEFTEVLRMLQEYSLDKRS